MLTSEKQKLGVCVVCTSPGFGGLEINTLRLCGELQQRGWSVTLLAREGGRLAQEADGNSLPLLTVRKGLLNILKSLYRLSPQLIITTFNKDLAPLAHYKRFFRRRTRLVYQQHMALGLSKRDIFHTLRYAMIDRWISPLETRKKEVLQQTRYPEALIEVVPLGLEPIGLLDDGTDPQRTARESLDLPQEVPMIGIVGRIDPKKGQGFLIQAMKRLRDTHRLPHHLLIAGEPTPGEGARYLEKLQNLVRALGLQSQVHFRPFQQNVALFYGAIDVFAMASDAETYGMVTLEAMSRRRPVIGTASGGTPELLQGGKLGRLFAPGDDTAFCRHVEALHRQPPGDAYLNCVQEEISRRYDTTRLHDQLEAILQAEFASSGAKHSAAGYGQRTTFSSSL